VIRATPFAASARADGFARTLERSAGITLSGLGVIVAALLAWLVARTLGGRTLYLGAYAGLLVVAIAVAMTRRRRPLVALRSSINRRARVGQEITVTLTVESSSRITTFRLEESLDSALGRDVVVPVSAIGPSSPVDVSYTFRPTLRGVYNIGPLVAEYSDPLGLVRRRQVLLDRVELVVHPNVEGVVDRPLTRAFEDPPLRPPKSRPWPDGFEFYGMRTYVPGDDLRRVVWRAFARTDQLLVREFEQGISDRVIVVVDTEREWHSQGTPSDTFETAVRVAASVGVRHIRQGFVVGLEAGYGSLGVFRSARGRLPFLDELARLRLSGEPLSDALERLVRASRRDSHVVIVTSHFDAVSAGRANLLVNGGASLTVCVVAWEESDPNSARRAQEVGAQLVQVRPGASLGGVFRASLQTNAGGARR
jgi:uncharacterized protein (DUF58 family)